MKSIVILISGRGSNMQALLDTKPNSRIAAVISNRADAAGLAIAQAHGIPTVVVSHKDYPDRISFDTELAKQIDCFEPDIVMLAGFMRILTPGFVTHYYGKLINIHPSLLPAYTGLHTHARVIADGVKIHGCTVHFVTPELDSGPIIIQAAIPVRPEDTEHSLSARILHEEHRIYPQAIKWLCSERIKLDANGKVIDHGAPLFPAALISPALDQS